MPKVLYIGDSETVISRYCVGADVFEQSYFNDNGRYLREAMHGQPEIELRHIIPAEVPNEFPTTDEELATYDVVIFSDVGYNSMIYYPGLTPPYTIRWGRTAARWLPISSSAAAASSWSAAISPSPGSTASPVTTAP